MTQVVEEALKNVNISYDNLIEVANNIFEETTSEIDELINNAYTMSESMTNDSIRDLMMKLALKSYSLSEIKEKSSFKAELAKTLKAEAYAQEFNEAQGTVNVRDNSAVLATGGEILASHIHNLVSNMLKTKLDEVHRVVNTLQSILMSRMQEAKLSTVDIQ